ncbi:Xaa-Pro peptidase family protein [uncultured Corynebacterium sp.]|uniref:M24 family metallopeptidase n=1 Tax=uncultured Corynebacterium sp. TaxID=159447 RepID=UPI00280567DE|nr:Xaa-Pro peptidase family protein [uncultured Corynebacterium sp.]
MTQSTSQTTNDVSSGDNPSNDVSGSPAAQSGTNSEHDRDAAFASRLERARRLVKDNQLEGLVFGSGVELEYFIGTPLFSHERLTALVITHDRAVLVAPAVERGEIEDSYVPRSEVTVDYWVDGQDPHDSVIRVLTSSNPSNDEGDTPSGTVGVGSTMTADHLLPLQDRGYRWVLAGPVLRELLMRKDAYEIEQLTAAGQAIDRVHAAVPGLLGDGRTERDVARDIEQLILKEHQAVDFIIVGSGPNGANPHHEYSDRIISAGDVVVVDIGGTLNGYHSDCTRTYVVGEPTEKQQEIYDVLQQAQKEAVSAAKPGVSAAQIDAIARNVITAAGYGDNFIHRTGHGIGLSTHEEPHHQPQA